MIATKLKTSSLNNLQKTKRVQGGISTSDLVMSAYVDGNAEIFPKILELHVPKGGVIADVTWGNGVFIFNPKTENLDRVETAFNDDFVALGFTNWKYQGGNYIVVWGDASLLLINVETLKSKMYEDKEGRFRVYDALQDKQGNLWLATEFGLKFINSKIQKFKV